MRILGLLVATVFFTCAPADAAPCTIPVPQTCNRLNLWPDRVVFLNCPLLINAPGDPRSRCSWDLCDGSRTEGGTTPTNAAAYCNATEAALQGILPGFYSVSSANYDNDGQNDADFRIIPSPTPSGSPSPAPSPTPTPTPTWADHQCGTAGMAASDIPVNAPSGTPFGQLANPVAACCALGWAQGAPGNSSYKMDCIDSGPTSDFLAFYNYVGGDADRDAGITRPNRFFATVAGGASLPGFYSSKGARCPYLDPVTLAPKNLTINQQYALFDDAIANGSIPTTSSVAKIGPDCHNLVLLALERRCPGTNPTVPAGRIWRAENPYSTVTRCTAAATMRTHFYVLDLSDSKIKKRGKFHAVSSLQNDPDADVFSTENIPYQKIIPQVFTLTPGACPEGFTANAADECVIN